MTSSAPHIYLDNSATTPLDPQVAAVIRTHLEGTFGNASSVHRYGRLAKVVLEEGRERIAAVIGAEPAEIFFTSGGTESDNHALIGTALYQRRTFGRDTVLVSAIEHHAVLDAAEYLQELGFTVVRLPVDTNGVVRLSAIEQTANRNCAVLSVMHANNETGMLQPVREIAAIARTHAIPFHSDTVQTVGKVPVKVDELGMDLLAVSAHKINGPKGVGAIYIRKGTGLDALLHGGAQERNNRAGTENVPLIAGFAEAMGLAEAGRESLYAAAFGFREALVQIIRQGVPDIILNAAPEHSLPHIISVSLDGSRYAAEHEALLLNMDLRGVAISSGSACTSGSIQPSHVLAAMGRDERTTALTVRFSFGKFTTIDEVTTAGRIFCEVVHAFPRL